jgi:ribonuclease G
MKPSPYLMIRKFIKKLFGKNQDIAEGTKIIINCEKLETRVALLEEGIVEEYNIERPDRINIVGNIFKGRVKNIEQGLKAMFVDVGLEKNAFLHFWDAIPAALDGGLEEIQRGNKKRKKITSADIPSIYPPGSEVLVQVTKGPIGNKGPRVTTNIALAGRLMVLLPLNDQFGISRKIDDPKERARLKKILQNLSVPEGMGVILRTVAQGGRVRHFVRDLRLLLEQWDDIVHSRDNNPAPICCFEEPEIVERMVRDLLTEEVDEVICDDQATVDRMKTLAISISKRAQKRIRYFQDNTSRPIFESLGLQTQIDDAFRRQVQLPCGGYLVIDETEALVAIDVNTGRNKGGGDADKTLLQTNLEAATEVARQVRLRNIGGLVVVDFIDMRHPRDQRAVYQMMKDRLKRDKAKVQVLPISQFGLMEMTRQRLSESLATSVNEFCPYCKGSGRIKSALSMSVELQRRLFTILGKTGNTHKELLIVVHPEVMNRLRTEDSDHLTEIQRRFECRLTFRAEPGYHREQMMIADAISKEEIK